MLVRLREILDHAEQYHYAVGMFNMLNLETARGIIAAAENMNSPIILGVAEVHLPYIPFEYASIIMKHMAEKSKVPVCLHFDHGTDVNKIKSAIDAGFTSVMYDGSILSFEENILNTRNLALYAHEHNCDIEAELGHVGGSEDSSEDSDICYTVPESVVEFLVRTEADALAVSIGTIHGNYMKEPKLDLDRLDKIYSHSNKPLVLHGGSGLRENDLKNTINKGIRKINICTDLCTSAQKAYKESGEFVTGINNVVKAVSDTTEKLINIFGSENKA